MRHVVLLHLLLLLQIYSASTHENVAMRGKATQSSLNKGEWSAFEHAYNAIDGNRNGDLKKGSCTHTEGENNPWWRVDLLDSYTITKVVITNRQDCCAERINGVEVHIGNSLQNHGTANPLVHTVSTISPGSSGEINLNPPVEGRYVTIVSPGVNKYLTLCEVEVYGYRSQAENVAMRGKATQSSLNKGEWSAFEHAYNAIDGNRNGDLKKGSCTHTEAENNPWWRVDLLDSYTITKVVITNRQDCCAERINGVEVHIGNSLQNHGTANPLVHTVSTISPGSSGEINLNPPVEGRYVTIVSPGVNKYLTLCEVEVYGYRSQTGDL